MSLKKSDIAKNILSKVGKEIFKIPSNFNAHKTLKRVFEIRKKMFESGSNNIPHNSKIETLIDKLVDTDQKFPVVNSETGELIGEIDRAIVMKSMKSAS